MIALDYIAALGSIYLFAVTWPLSRIDIREHRLPNKFVLPAFPITLIGFLPAAVFNQGWIRFSSAICAALVALVIGFLLNRYGSLGMGDVKLIAATTMSLSWFNLASPLIALVLGFVVAAVFIGIQLIRGKSNLKDSVALGPYLLLGFVVTQILTWSSYFGGFAPNFFR
jgi:leader peptidase (prepilin peptidase)/N-methyltransferase